MDPDRDRVSAGDRDLDKCYDVVMKLVLECGEIIATRNTLAKTISVKLSPMDLVTETDQEVERRLIQGLKSVFKSHQFIGEEGTSDGGRARLTDAPTWVIDPVDGTMNFVHSFPYSCISIALIVDKVTEIGIIYNPHLKQMFTARRNQGAQMNGKPIHSSGQTEFSKALIAGETGSQVDNHDNIIKNLRAFVDNSHGIRLLGTAAISCAYVALGAVDAFYHAGLHIWDYAAGDLIIREAGGVCVDPTGGPLDLMSRRVLCASTMELATQIAKVITQLYPSPRDDE